VVSSAGDPFAYAGQPLAEMTPSKREKLLREHYAKEYRADLRRIMASGGFASVTDEEDFS
jgi:hypothetical protein